MGKTEEKYLNNIEWESPFDFFHKCVDKSAVFPIIKDRKIVTSRGMDRKSRDKIRLKRGSNGEKSRDNSKCL